MIRTRAGRPGRRPRRWAVRLALVIAMTAAPSVALGQEVYGRVWDGGSNQALSGAEVKAQCGGATVEPARTDRYGLYRLSIGRTGVTCDVWLEYRGMDSTRVRVYVSSRRTLADIEARPGRGKWTLIRR